MLRKITINKNTVIAFTFLMAIGVFAAITVADYFYRLSDYTFYSKSILSIIEKTFRSEREFLNQRNQNYMNALFVQEKIPELVRKKEIKRLKEIYDPVFTNFGYRRVPVILFTVVDLKGTVLYQRSAVKLDAANPKPISGTLQHVLEHGTFVSGFENDFLPFWYDIGIPIVDQETKQQVGALEVGLDPEWFQFKFGWFFEGVKSAMVVRETDTCTPENNAADCYRFIDKTVAPLKDLQFFNRVMLELKMGSIFSEIKSDGAYYMVSTALRFQNHDGREAGSFLVAYNMTPFKAKQWQYLYTRLILFLPALAILLTAIYLGFRKHEQVINEKNKLLAQKSKNCALGEMLGYIGHQWRQPLHTLSLAVQNIELQHRLGQLDDAMLVRQVALANQNINYMSGMIDDWRALLTSGSSRQQIDLKYSIERAIAMVMPVMEQNRIVIDNQIDESVKTMGFVNDLVQLTVNVLLNAKDQLCLQEGERLIRLSCSLDQSLVTVSFQDNAGGIPKRLLSTVFEPYVTTKETTKGTGLGLYLCRQIAENLDDGKVWAENRPFDQDGTSNVGACICLQFSRLVE